MGREFGLPLNVKAAIQRWYLVLGCTLFLGISTAAWGTTYGQHPSTSGTDRHLASLPFPHVSEVSDTNDILDSYIVYLKFVTTVASDIDYRSSQGLGDKFKALRKRDPNRAAQFLKGLRFEMEQYLQLKAIPRARLHSDSGEMRRWVGKFVRVWHREVDEALYRAKANAFTKSLAKAE